MPTNNESPIKNNPPTEKRRLRVLLSAYACEPGKGSEAGVGWNMALQMAKLHDVYVVTRANNEPVITPELPGEDAPKFIYYDLPKWAMWWKRGIRGAELYYFLWQIFSGRMLKKSYADFFDVGHHVTYVRYWMPTCFPKLGIPYVIGPVGGGEFAPVEFENRFSLKPLIYEKVRRLIRTIVPLIPSIRASISNASCILSTTKETRVKVQALGARRIDLYPESGVSSEEYRRLSSIESTADSSSIVFVSSGRFLALKAFELGLRAFAESGLDDAKYWFVGDGPERKRLEKLTDELRLTGRVTFYGMVSRDKALDIMGQANILIHPSLHDSGGWVCPEAMAMGKAVICLDLGGPGAQVDSSTGIKVSPDSRTIVVDGMAKAMRHLAKDRVLLASMGKAGKAEVADRYVWENKCAYYSRLYENVLGEGSTGTVR